MISFNEFAAVPENGILCVQEGTLLRVYFDIKPYDRQPIEGEAATDGPDIFECQTVNVYGRTYGDVVSAIVNDRYSADDVQALQANFIEAKDADSALLEAKREEYLAEYATFQEWRKHAKEIASAVVELIN